MRLIEQTKLDYDDVLLLPKRSTLASRKDVDLQRIISFPHTTLQFKGIPIIAANMDSVATLDAAKVFQQHDMFTCLHKFIPIKEIIDSGLRRDRFAITIGKDNDALQILTDYHDDFDYLCIDIANGYSEDYAKFISKARTLFPNHIIFAGNVCTPEMTEELILAGASAVKIGIGPGQMCLTRRQTGVGMPQFSAVVECADAAHGVGGRVIGDGGIKHPGDFAKCFGAGADFAMAGSVFAGHRENSNIDSVTGKVKVYGMSSTEAMKKYYGGVNDYRTSEGRVVEMNNRGNLSSTITEILGGLRSSCTYIGAKNLKDFSKCATFVRVNNQLAKDYEPQTIGK